MPDKYTSEDDRLTSEDNFLPEDNIFRYIPKNKRGIICSECKHEIIVVRDTFLPDNCPNCGRPYNYAKAVESALMRLIDLFLVFITVKPEVNDDED